MRGQRRYRRSVSNAGAQLDRCGGVPAVAVRSMYLEDQVAVLLGHDWGLVGTDWGGWDFQSNVGVHRSNNTTLP